MAQSASAHTYAAVGMAMKVQSAGTRTGMQAKVT